MLGVTTCSDDLESGGCMTAVLRVNSAVSGQ